LKFIKGSKWVNKVISVGVDKHLADNFLKEHDIHYLIEPNPSIGDKSSIKESEYENGNETESKPSTPWRSYLGFGTSDTKS
jgi:hypothetical protein